MHPLAILACILAIPIHAFARGHPFPVRPAAAVHAEADRDGRDDACDADYDNDHVVDLPDFRILEASFGLMRGEPGYRSVVDSNADDVIDARDLACFVAHWGHRIEPGHACP